MENKNILGVSVILCTFYFYLMGAVIYKFLGTFGVFLNGVFILSMVIDFILIKDILEKWK